MSPSPKRCLCLDRPRLAQAIWLIAVFLLVAGCQRSAKATPTVVAMPGPTASAENGSDNEAVTAADEDTDTLRVWLPPDISTASVVVQGRNALLVDLLAEQAQFDTEITVEATTKALLGSGGLRESILATAPVVPERVPHLALIDTADLPALVEAGLAQPITNEALTTSVTGDWPFAGQGVTVDGTIYAVPLCTDLLVMAYDATDVKAPPATWAELLTGPETLALPGARSTDAADVLLTLYLSEGGEVATSGAVLDTSALSRALSAYQIGSESGAIDAQASELSSFELAWGHYVTGEVNLATISTVQLLRDGVDTRDTHIATLPVSGSRPVVLGRTLAWVLIAQDDELQHAALQLVSASLTPEMQQELCERTFHLPAGTAGMEAASIAPWRDELANLLRVAQAVPATSGYAAVESGLTGAATSVISGSSTPAAAASLAAARLQSE